jgi:hypothetical protein
MYGVAMFTGESVNGFPSTLSVSGFANAAWTAAVAADASRPDTSTPAIFTPWRIGFGAAGAAFAFETAGIEAGVTATVFVVVVVGTVETESVDVGTVSARTSDEDVPAATNPTTRRKPSKTRFTAGKV